MPVNSGIIHPPGGGTLPTHQQARSREKEEGVKKPGRLGSRKGKEGQGVKRISNLLLTCPKKRGTMSSASNHKGHLRGSRCNMGGGERKSGRLCWRREKERSHFNRGDRGGGVQRNAKREEVKSRQKSHATTNVSRNWGKRDEPRKEKKRSRTGLEGREPGGGEKGSRNPVVRKGNVRTG